MFGSIIGDIVGSRFEFENFKSKEFDLFGPGCDFTDDTICTIATANWLLSDKNLIKENYSRILQQWCRNYPNPMGGYGGRFKCWIFANELKPYGSFGNGSAMRVSPVGWFFNSLEQTLQVAQTTAHVTHNHPEGIKGAQATAAAIYLARTGNNKTAIRHYIQQQFGYNLSQTCDEIRPGYSINETCQGTVPQALVAFLDSTDFEDAIRNAISLGGDADTLTCITGSVAEAYYGLNENDDLILKAITYLPEDLVNVVSRFKNKIS